MIDKPSSFFLCSAVATMTGAGEEAEGRGDLASMAETAQRLLKRTSSSVALYCREASVLQVKLLQPGYV